MSLAPKLVQRSPVCSAKGLFRVAPSASKLKKLKAALDCCVVDVQEYSADPHAIAGRAHSRNPGWCQGLGDTEEGDAEEGDTGQERLCRSREWSGRFTHVIIQLAIFSLPLLGGRASPGTALSPQGRC